MDKYKIIESITKHMLAANATSADIDKICSWIINNIHNNDLEIPKNIKKAVEEIIEYLKEYEQKYGIEFTEIREQQKLVETFKIIKEQQTISTEISQEFFENIKLIISKTGIYTSESKNLSYEQTKFLSALIYKGSDYQIIPFFVTKNYKGKGKIISKRSNGRQEFSLIREFLSRDETNAPFLKFPDSGKIDTRKYKEGKEVSGSYFVYGYLDHTTREEYTLLAEQELTYEEYTIEGMKFYLKDATPIGQFATLSTKLPILIVNSVETKTIPFKDHKEFMAFVNERMFNKNCTDYIFTLPVKGKLLLYDHPLWFKRFITVSLLSSKKGTNPCYPLHLLIVAREGTGKTSLQECVNTKFREVNDIVSAESCTLKYFVPSYARSPPDPGILTKSNRICIIDELLRAIFTNTKNDVGRNELLAKMNSLLEHRKRAMGSGAKEEIGEVLMTARAFAVTNPVHGTTSMELLCEHIDKSAISRWLVYYQDEEHIKFIQKKRLKEIQYWLEPEDFIAIIDYLHSFEASFDDELISGAVGKFNEVLSASVKTVYQARYEHHAQCLMDGIIKLRCIEESDVSFTANNEDYKNFEEYWSRIIRSWSGEYATIKLLDKDLRVKHLPSDAQEIWRYVVEHKGRVNATTLKESLSQIMHGNRLNTLLVMMLDWEILSYEGSELVAFYHQHNGFKVSSSEKIFQRCVFCDLPESVTWSRTGKPMCELCLKNPSLEKEWPEIIIER